MPKQVSITLVSRIYRPEASAASLVLGAVADEAISRGHEVTVFGALPPKKLQRAKRAESGETLKMFPVLRDAEGYVRGYFSYLSFDLPLFVRLLLAHKPDVYLVEPPPTTGAILRLVSRIKGSPYVYRAADLWAKAAEHVTTNPLVIGALKSTEKFAIKGANSVIIMAEQFAEQIQEFIPDIDSVAVGHGADTSQFFYEKSQLGKFFIYPGTYTELHGADILLNAFAKVAATQRDAKLLFVGNSHLREKFQEQVEDLGISDQVEFSQAITPEELRPLLNQALCSLATLDPNGHYAFAFTSKIFSALASGSPVLFAGSGPTMDYINAHPELNSVAVEYSSEAIATAMLHQLENPLPPEEREKTANWIKANASLQAAASKIVDELEKASVQRNQIRPNS